MSTAPDLQAMSIHQPELSTLKKTYKILPWSIRAQVVLEKAGINGFDVKHAENAETPIVDKSLASLLGHKTLGDFVTTPECDGGLGIAWDEWYEEALATRVKKEFEIATDDPKEVVRQFNDVTKVMGREPLNAQEYHLYKDNVLKQQSETKIAQLSEKNDELVSENRQYMQENTVLQEGNICLTKEVSELKGQIGSVRTQVREEMSIAHNAEINTLKDKYGTEMSVLAESHESEIAALKNGYVSEMSSVKKQHNEAVKQLESSLSTRMTIAVAEAKTEAEAKSKKELEQAVTMALAEQKNVLATEYDRKVEVLVQEHQGTVSTITYAHEAELKAKQEIVDNALAYYNSDNFVKAEEYNDVLGKVDLLNETVSQYLGRVESLQIEKEQMTQATLELSSQLTEKNSMIQNMQVGMEGLEQRLVALMGGEISDSVRVIEAEKLDAIMDKLNKYYAAYNKLHGSNKQLAASFNKSQKQLANTKKMLSTRNKQLASSNTVVKVFVGMSLVLATGLGFGVVALEMGLL
ncbi:hypothetical protein [Neptuniibacter sp. QD37_11]|uniref:hypothetical protein n=1 Tax=Neptuniibacter sp. QD37_11 TaxID=3398209 RepID=UPI0039F54B47